MKYPGQSYSPLLGGRVVASYTVVHGVCQKQYYQILPGQFGFVHVFDAVCVEYPGQSCPPLLGGGLLHCRVCVYLITPSPHVTGQGGSGTLSRHADHAPCTETLR